MKVRPSVAERHVPWGRVAFGVTFAAVGTTVAAFGAREAGAGYVIAFVRPRRTETSQKETIFPISKDQLRDGALFVSIGHSMLVPDGKTDPTEGTHRKNTVDDYLKQKLQARFPDIHVDAQNFAVVGSKNGQLLHQLQTNEELRNLLITTPGFVNVINYIGENDMQYMLTSPRALRRLNRLRNLRQMNIPRRVITLVRDGLPTAFTFKRVGESLKKSQLQIFQELARLNHLRTDNGNPPLICTVLEGVDFGEAPRITAWPPEGVKDVEPTVIPLDSAEGKQAGTMVANTCRRARLHARARHMKRNVMQIIPVSVRGVEQFFNPEGDQHVGPPGEEFMADRVFHALGFDIPNQILAA
ncbi:MAG: hypothetical protein KGJ07_06220 [Patescibacteria group bacterium]|nr:hypothetical protein [Patescibacteria group bacterium]MDE2591085.1 hypothetical protein [Patescibacteria group bacterium]